MEFIEIIKNGYKIINQDIKQIKNQIKKNIRKMCPKTLKYYIFCTIKKYKSRKLAEVLE